MDASGTGTRQTRGVAASCGFTGLRDGGERRRPAVQAAEDDGDVRRGRLWMSREGEVVWGGG